MQMVMRKETMKKVKRTMVKGRKEKRRRTAKPKVKETNSVSSDYRQFWLLSYFEIQLCNGNS